ncbi:MAG TPA: error-prone DNA polymerase, partial [Solirubrobacteraceae bacterium]|nr:error-prone DNA polymerase [Solirubrobacteraceae bacterium]
SIVCYLTGLSHIDPIAGELALGRFLHEDLRGLPDIDLDFPRDIRQALIPRVVERYGSERAALVAAFPTFRERGAIRELGKVLGLPPGELERAARGAERHGDGAELDLAWVAHRETAGEGRPEMVSPRWRWLQRLVAQARGLPRHLSQHSGGMIVATRPLVDCVPVVPAAMEGRQMVQWDKDSCADAGFLKIDLLGLGMLSAVERCVVEIERVRGRRVDLSRIPFDDDATFAAIREADTVGVFQIESRAQMQSLRRTRPESLADITIQVAIVRPGPIQGGAVNPYIERRRRLREEPDYEIPYEHPSLEAVLGETLGTIIFQDQVMQVAEAFAGFTPGEADGLRRAMSRKRSHEHMQRHREDFLAGAREHVGADRRTGERVWGMVEGFAGFGFPKAHGAAFGLLAYQSTWLRVHYGPEFLCSLLNEQPMGFYAPDSLVHEAQRRGIPVLGLDVNASQVLCTVQDVAGVLGVRLGLGYVKDVVAEEVEVLVAERERGGRYRSPEDLAARSGAGRGTLAQLAWSGACDELVGDVESGAGAGGAEDARGDAAGGARAGTGAAARDARRRVALWQMGLASPARAEPTGEGIQLALGLELPAAPRLRPLGRWERLIADYSASGVTAGDHAMAILRERISLPMLATSAQLARLPSGCAVTVAGLVIARQRPGTAKGVMFLLFEDEHGVVNLIVPRHVYERHRHLARAEPLLIARGRLERSEGVVNVLVSELLALERHLRPALGEERREGSVHRLAGGERSAVGDGACERGTFAEPERAAEVGSSMRAAAPPMQSFGRGRRR